MLIELPLHKILSSLRCSIVGLLVIFVGLTLTTLSGCCATTPPLAQSHLNTYDNTLYPLIDAELNDRLNDGTLTPITEAIIRADLDEFRDALNPSTPLVTPGNSQ